VLDWASVRKFRRGENPARWKGCLESLLPKPASAKRAVRRATGRAEHHAALPYDEIAAFVTELRRQDGMAARALEFAVLTGGRTGEVIGTRWDEVNFAERVWTVPADRMKAGREHRVPLAPPAITILEGLSRLRPPGDDAAVIFAGPNRRKPLSNMAMLMLLRRRADGPRLSAIEDVLRTSFPWCGEWADALKQLFAAYVEAKQRQGVLDYDDLILYWAQMMTDRDLAAEIGGRFDHILVDEYQDTNRLQAAILLALKPDGAGLTVVGDDAQSIYSFRGATVRNILDFPGQFSPPAEIVTLARNYRSTQAILAAANGLIGLASEHFTKNLWTDRSGGERPQLVAVRDEADQARYVVERILENREAGARLKQQAVLFRASHHSGPLEIELTRRNIPFVKFGGLKFLEAAHVKDLLAVLRFVENPRDRISGFRVLQLLPGPGLGAAHPRRDCRGGRRARCTAACKAAARPRALERLYRDGRRPRRRRSLLAGRRGTGPPLVRALSRAPLRRRTAAPGGFAATRADRCRLSILPTFPDGADARPARCDERRSRRAAARRGLPGSSRRSTRPRARNGGRRSC
jgi:UvrD/REP helicase N-terminal domain/UvrD-like helicase C-terminal domain/Phage integrase family